MADNPAAVGRKNQLVMRLRGFGEGQALGKEVEAEVVAGTEECAEAGEEPEGKGVMGPDL